MSKTIEIAKELKEELDKLPLFQEYYRYKALVDSNKELNALKTSIAKAKLEGNSELHKNLLDRYNSHPLIVNYQELETEVANYLAQVAKIVNKK